MEKTALTTESKTKFTMEIKSVEQIAGGAYLGKIDTGLKKNIRRQSKNPKKLKDI